LGIELGIGCVVDDGVICWSGFSECWIHDGLYTQYDGRVTTGMLWLGRFVRGAYLLEPTILQMTGGLNT
jgi:hypothetical protein